MRKVILSGTSAIALGFAIGGSAVAADLPIKSAPRVLAPQQFSWSGFYIGGHIGGGSGRFDFNSCPTICQSEGSGPVGGIQLGFNWQSGNIVWGIEGDVSAANLHSGDGDYVYANVDLLSSIRGRLGIAFDRVLVYATGGGAVVLAKGAGSTTPLTWKYNSHFRGVVGGGIEYAINNNLTVRGEALGYLGSHTFFASDDTATIKDIWIGRFGANYKF